MPPFTPLDERLRRTAERFRPRNQNAQTMFDAYVRASIHKGICNIGPIDVARAFGKALERIRVPELHSWVDVRKLWAEVRNALPDRQGATAARGVFPAAEQLSLEGSLPPRVFRLGRGQCSLCGQERVIGRVSEMLCIACVQAPRLQDKYDRLCRRFSFSDEGRRDLFASLISHVNGRSLRYRIKIVRAMGKALEQFGPVTPITSWRELHELRRRINELPKKWQECTFNALYNVEKILIEKGTLSPLYSKGTVREQLFATMQYFDFEDPQRRELVQALADYFLATRVTSSSVLMVEKLGRHLQRYPAPELSNWADLDKAIRDIKQRRVLNARTVVNAFMRLGDAFLANGRFSKRPHKDELEVIQARLQDFGSELNAVHQNFIADCERIGRRPSTLREYVKVLNQFWSWANKEGISHPTQVSLTSTKSYVAGLRRKRCSVAQQEHHKTILRVFFNWLRQQRLVLSVPVPERLRAHRRPIRVCPRSTFETLTRAISTHVAPAEASLILYLIMFHGFRNFEVARVRGLGFHDGRFVIDVSEVPDHKSPRSTSRSGSLVSLPTNRVPWLRDIVQETLNQRAHKVKVASNPFLFVSGCWNCGNQPISLWTVFALVRDVTTQLLGHSVSATVLRTTGAALLSDQGNHTNCIFLGWNRIRAMAFAYATREVVVGQQQENIENKNCSKRKRKLPRPNCITGIKRVEISQFSNSTMLLDH